MHTSRPWCQSTTCHTDPLAPESYIRKIMITAPPIESTLLYKHWQQTSSTKPPNWADFRCLLSGPKERLKFRRINRPWWNNQEQIVGTESGVAWDRLHSARTTAHDYARYNHCETPTPPTRVIPPTSVPSNRLSVQNSPTYLGLIAAVQCHPI